MLNPPEEHEELISNMCTLWEMAETIRAEERQAAEASKCENERAERALEKPARFGTRMKSRWLAITALFTSSRQFTQN